MKREDMMKCAQGSVEERMAKYVELSIQRFALCGETSIVFGFPRKNDLDTVFKQVFLGSGYDTKGWETSDGSFYLWVYWGEDHAQPDHLFADTILTSKMFE